MANLDPCTVSDPNDLLPADRRILANYWRSRGEGEMGAERFFIRLIEDLKVIGVPQSLIELAHRARKDEAKHGRWGRDWAVFFGHRDVSDPVADRSRPFELSGASERENRLIRVAFCSFTETCGCHVLRDIRPRISYGLLRANNREHLADELVHARIGWGALTSLSDSDKDLLRPFIPRLLRLLPQAVVDGPEDEALDHLVPWGYLTPSVLRAAHERAVREVIVPGLRHLTLVENDLQGAA